MTNEKLWPAIRQFRHNNDNSPNLFEPEQGFVMAYDAEIVDAVVAELEAQLEAQVEACDCEWLSAYAQRLEAELADKEGQRAWLQNELDAALRRIDGLNAQREDWQPIETAPPQKAVLLHYKTEYGFWLTIRAEFVPEATRDVDDQPYDGDAVYDKVTDRHWWPEGWYELIDNWGDMSCVMVHGAPYRWMLLPAAPNSATQQERVMDDIVNRLREAHPISAQYANGSRILLDAADRIAELEASLSDRWENLNVLDGEIDALRERIAELLEQDAAKDDSMLVMEHRISELEAQLAAAGWVSVKDRLPADNDLVLVHPLGEEGGTDFDFIEDGVWVGHEDNYQHFMELGGYRMCGDDVSVTGPSAVAPYTHWMPLPAAPDSATSAGGE